MCTRVMWRAAGQPVVVGRDTDWKQGLGTNPWVLPRGVERVGARGDDPAPLRWTASCGSAVATSYDSATTDGVDERGLGAHPRKHEGFGGELPLPGTTEAADRFVRAPSYLDRLPPAGTPARAYAALLSVMRNAAQPFGTPDPAGRTSRPPSGAPSRT